MTVHDDAWARDVLIRVWPTSKWPITVAALQAVQAVGRLEGRYGYPQDPQWQGSHNWGAIQAPHGDDSNSFEHKDTHADGTVYVARFRKYPTDEDGASDLIRELYRRGPVAAILIEPGPISAAAMAKAMHDTGYFELAPEKYAQRIFSNAQAIAKSLGEPLEVTGPGTPGAGSAPSHGAAPAPGGSRFDPLMEIAVLGGAGYLVWRMLAHA